ncbi:MAG: phosphodiester glycosidase family protein [Candidatus Wallbacteria bacterium]
MYLFSKNSITVAIIAAGLILSNIPGVNAAENKIFKIKDKPAQTQEKEVSAEETVTGDQGTISEIIEETKTAKETPKAKKNKKADAKAKKSSKKVEENKEAEAPAPSKAASSEVKEENAPSQPKSQESKAMLERIANLKKEMVENTSSGKSSSVKEKTTASNIGNENSAYKFDEYGIAVTQKKYSKSSGDVPLTVIRVDLNQKKVNPKIVLAKGKLGTKAALSDICKSYNAVAGINGSFFDMKTYAAVGYLMIDGKAIQAPLIVKSRTTFGINSDNHVMIGKPKFRRRIRPQNDFFSMIDGINKKCVSGEIVIYTSEYGKNVTIPNGAVGFQFDAEGVVSDVLKGKVAIPEEGGILVVTDSHLHRFKNTEKGTKILFTQTLMAPWDKTRDAFGSGMLIVAEGKAAFDQTREEVGKYLMGDAPRTAVGITAENHLIMVAADGRGKGYRGVDFDDIAQIMVDEGCTDAIALDGGGSTTAVYKGEVLNSPSEKGGAERKIANALVLLPANEKITPEPVK